MYPMLVPPTSAQQSSAKPTPYTPSELIISIASLKAKIQSFADATPPWGNPIPLSCNPYLNGRKKEALVIEKFRKLFTSGFTNRTKKHHEKKLCSGHC